MLIQHHPHISALIAAAGPFVMFGLWWVIIFGSVLAHGPKLWRRRK